MRTRIIVNGASGKMGQEALMAIEQHNSLQLVGQLGSQHNLEKEIKALTPDIVLDLTCAQAVYKNMMTIIKARVHPVIGTSGLTEPQLAEAQALCHQQKLGGLIIPNFSIAAVLMMQLATQASKYLKHAEIVEVHHDDKKDAPSGTAIHTAALLSENITKTNIEGVETLPGAKGASCHGVQIHSLRLPGFLAQQEVIFGSPGEQLTIRHATINRQCFMPGLILSCEKVSALNELVVGLEHLL